MAAVADAGASSSSRRPSPISRSRRLRILLQAAPQQRPIEAGAPAAAPPNPALAQHCGQRVGHLVALKRALARQHFEEHAPNAQSRCACRRPAPRLLRAHVGGRAEDDADACIMRRRCDGRRLRHDPATRRSGSMRLRQPEVQHLDRAVRPHLELAGFRSRWMMPCSCAASSASAICLAIGSASSSGIGPCAIRSASVGPSTSSMHERRRRHRIAPGRRCAAILGWFRAASVFASRSKRARRSASSATASGRTLCATSASGSCRARDTPRPSRPHQSGRQSHTGRSECQEPMPLSGHFQGILAIDAPSRPGG